MDEFGIFAEHLQKAKAILTPIITTIFNQSIEENSISIFSKIGITNPVLKKSKDATQVEIKVITKLPNTEQSYKGKVKTHMYINRQNQSTTEKLKTVMTLTWYRHF